MLKQTTSANVSRKYFSERYFESGTFGNPSWFRKYRGHKKRNIATGFLLRWTRNKPFATPESLNSRLSTEQLQASVGPYKLVSVQWKRENIFLSSVAGQRVKDT